MEKSAPNERQRLAALNALDILDTEYEQRFDRITRLAQRLFGTEIAAVTLVDERRQWFKSRQGPLESEGTREDSFCSQAIKSPNETMVIGDASRDPRFAENPLVTGDPNIRFYAGQPIKAPGGEPIGALCVVDSQPRVAADVDEASLRDLAAMVEDEIAALSLAITDELTGISNRRGFEMLAPRIYSVAQRVDAPVTLVYIDVDNLKPLNDNCGHDAGDRALIETASLLQSELRGSDVVARLGGDEFAVLLTNADEADAAAAVARIESAIDARNAETSEPFELQLSVGAVSANPNSPGRSLDRLVDEADARMIAAKRDRKQAALAA
jgi:diguanylate cyclase (GGDEF)-like protein